MAVSLAACAGNSEPAETSTPDAESSISAESTTPESSEAVSEPESELATDSQTEETESPADTDTESIGTNVLVAYFFRHRNHRGRCGEYCRRFGCRPL